MGRLTAPPARHVVGVALTAACWALTVAALALVWFALTDAVPNEFTGMTPYVATLLVLALASQRLRMPAADGAIYRKGEAS